MSALRPMDIDRRLGICAAVLILVSALGAVTLAPESLAMPITAAELRLTPCEQKTREGEATADCGTLVVPENRTMPQARMISLPVIRIRATGRNPGEPLFWLEGGPGRTNVGFQPPASLLARHDFVMVGYRGVDGSNVLDCPEVSYALHGVNGDLLSDASRRHLAEAASACARRLQGQGVDLAGYTMAEVVADLEMARTALGYGTINLLSESYGTRIAQIYAALHPERLSRSAMIGVNPPGHFVWEPGVIDAQLRDYARLCAADQICRGRTSNLAATISNVSHNMPKRWLLFPIDPGKVKVVTFLLLFNRGSAAMVFDAYLAAEKGDASGLALLSIASDFALPTIGVWGDFLAKGSADFDPARDYKKSLAPAGSILGSPLSLLLFDGLARNWPAQPLSAALFRVQPSAVETLLVSGSVDFSTPPQFATNELLPNLAKGQQVILRQMGHTTDMWGLQPQATEHLLNSFYETGVGDTSHYVGAPLDFRPRFALPLVAKLVLATGLLLLGASGAVVALAVRRIRRRSNHFPHGSATRR